MTDAPNNAPYVLPYQLPGTLPNARNLVGIQGIQVLDSGPGQALTITPTGNLLALTKLSSHGFVYSSSSGVFTTKTFADSFTTDVNESSGVLSIQVLPKKTNQLLDFKHDSSVVGTAACLNISGGNKISVDASYDSSSNTVHYSITGGALAPSSPKYILQTTNSDLPNAQSLGQLTTGLLKNTVTSGTGVLSKAIAGTDYVVPNDNLTDLSSIAPVLGRLIVGDGDSWTNRDIGASGTFLQSNGTDCFWGTVSSVAPSSAPYITFTASTALTNEQNLGLLSSGLLKNTVSSGSATLSAAVNGTDYYGPGFTIPVSSGGTGQTTANAAFNALSPMAHDGDLITRSSNIATALQIGTNGQVLTVVSGMPAWATATVYAPSNAKYVTLQTESGLSEEFSLGSLTTGLLLNTVSGGVATLSKAVNGTDYYGPGFTIPIASGGTGASTKTAAFDALSPMTTAGDLIVGGTNGSGIRLPKGTAHQVLAMNSDASALVWETNSADASGWSTFSALQSVNMAGFKVINMADPVSDQDAVTKGYLTTNYNPKTYIADIAHGGTGQTTANTAFNALSPMTSPGDIIYRNNSNVATNLAIGGGGQVLTVYGGLPVWANLPHEAPINGPYLTFTANASLTNAQNLGTLTTGLLLNTVSGGTASVSKATNGTDYYGPGYAVRIADGGTGQTTASAGFNALSPTTTTGDIIYRNSSGVNTRLGIGSNGQVLTVSNDIPSWQDSAGDITSIIAGAGLTGGGTSGDITLAVAPATILDSSTTSATLAAFDCVVSMHASTRVALSLPTTAAAGSRFCVAGYGAGGWQITQNADQSISFGNQTTTTGTGGSLASTEATDGVEIVCVVANTTFLVTSTMGNITLV